mgnify:CR=1 FL=1
MSWNKVSPGQALDIKKLGIGKEYEGTLLGKRSLQTKIGLQTVWLFSGADEADFEIYGFTNLNIALESIKIGTLVKIKYLGTKNCQTKYGQKDVHQVDVEKWTEEGREPGDDSL